MRHYSTLFVCMHARARVCVCSVFREIRHVSYSVRLWLNSKMNERDDKYSEIQRQENWVLGWLGRVSMNQ